MNSAERVCIRQVPSGSSNKFEFVQDMINDAHTPGDGETSADAAAGWSRCASLLQDRDEAQFKAWNVNIDALLTFVSSVTLLILNSIFAVVHLNFTIVTH